ncbi:MAG: hypothetical protein IGQ88_03020, partial [Gloeomargaritaceae cyanobacterium C42_A2020_066]|nr:hypothetical protein [Gloeomargaritaceae cyanobacterium C42_A2020_066]
IANLLALVVIVGSLALYLEALALTPLQRPNDLIWSGVGLFYGLVLWIEGDRLQGGLLAGQVASVALLVWLGTQVWRLRQVEAGQRVALLDLIRAVAKLAQQLQAPRPAGPATESPISTPKPAAEEAPQAVAPPESAVPPPTETESSPQSGLDVEISLETQPAEPVRELEPEPVAPPTTSNSLTSLIGFFQSLVRRAPRPAESPLVPSEDIVVMVAETTPPDVAAVQASEAALESSAPPEPPPPPVPAESPDRVDAVATSPELPTPAPESTGEVPAPVADSPTDGVASDPAPVHEETAEPAFTPVPSDKNLEDSDDWPPPQSRL